MMGLTCSSSFVSFAEDLRYEAALAEDTVSGTGRLANSSIYGTYMMLRIYRSSVYSV